MFGLFYFFKRLYTIFNPPVAPKRSDALRFGILGAATVAPQSLIIPARSHPEVIVAAVAARDQKRAHAFAKKHRIPIVHKSYDDLLADPTIDCVYIPLPIGLHYEWALKAIKAGKHVLLEKPCVSNATEARSLFRHPVLNKPDAPILLEAFHQRFYPSWQTFMSLFDSEDVEEVNVKSWLFAGLLPFDDIRFNYALSGGTFMDYGAYAVSTVRSIFASEPTAIKSATYRPLPNGFDEHCDEAMFATYEFANGGTAKLSVDLQATGGYWFPALTRKWPNFRNFPPWLTVKLRAKKEGTEGRFEKWTQKSVIMNNYMVPHLWHRIDIVTNTEYRDTQEGGKLVRHEKNIEHMKAYNWLTSEKDRKCEEWWSTYRYQLEEFVNQVKRREGSGVWIDGDDSIKQMELVDKTYLLAGLPLRPTSQALETM
ncbi:oxidoreductase domain-containing protein [Massariosphaeria phaeospora]|uniref:D-xylose 1-dehydrogenase (NADP(+), D-xylono-1,5-lactone-forming) n=1 Tax=Massariosphaeria phaeospora TaxID=100035 RepID=A0A7C8M465_9PLEO|nr:oxidoreductase domain-containing protein [Massariosphaeria phaeospora]